MNILEQEDIIKGLPDQALMKEASAPERRGATVSGCL